VDLSTNIVNDTPRHRGSMDRTDERQESVIAPPLAPQWVLHPRHAPERAQSLARELEAPIPAAHALLHRDIATSADARRYLEPGLDHLHDPSGMMDLDAAVARIRQALIDHERIMIHGDYDVDGITATYLLYSVLRDLGGGVEFRIPHRTRDGYGLSIDAIEDAARRGCSVVITVDCGITAVAPIARARELGIDVVVTDHHEPGERLPDAVAILNPHRGDCGYPFKSLAGVGVTFKLVEALLRGRGGLERASEYLDVVAIGTIADVVPLVGENRVLARLGLDRLNRTPRIGLQALMDVTGLAGRSVGSGQIAFVLAPRINAGGRMGNAEQGLRLLLARDGAEARSIAESLEEDNVRRRQYDEQALIEASRMVEEELGWPDCCSIMLWSESWHPGVIGIVASRLVERYQRPTLLVSMRDGVGRGSGRSLPGLDLNQVLGQCSDLLDAWGGHAFAAGVTVQRDRLPTLRDRFEALVRARLAPGEGVRPLTVDANVSLSECTLELADWVDRMSPHGLGNPEPVFAANSLEVLEVAVVGGGRHARLRVRDHTGLHEAIGFGYGDHAAELARAGRCDAAFVPSRHEWQGVPRVQLKLKGIRTP
jgi:single-stranded-DNA-specific exonuclease